MAVTLWVVFTVLFFLMRAIPGGPFDGERQLEPAIEANMKARYGLDQPIWMQYANELWRDLHCDFGYSYRRADFSVREIVGQALPVSAALGLLALTFAVTLGLTAGTISAVRRRSSLDFGFMTLATLGIAVPNFVVASIAIILFAFVWPVFPAAGWGKISQMVLPAFCLGAPYAAYIARLSRTGMLDVLSQDYIRTAYAKGLSTRAVIFRHALKGAMLPVVSYLGPAIAGILTGSLVIETIFFVPGLGAHAVQSALQRDWTLSMGLALLYTTILCSMNLLVDFVYTLLDPRVKLQ
ncbi:MAG: ABC transporter permease subunit [Pirellulales bacterium]|nr:ABC transporter permease subunit [Pirellulales bacterium]